MISVVKDVLKGHQGQGADYETPRNVLSSESKLKFTSFCRVAINDCTLVRTYLRYVRSGE